MNIADEAPEVTRYNNSDTPLYRFLTKYERETETLFTPRHFQYVDYLHAASSEDFGRTQTVYKKKFKVHLVQPGDYDDYCTYAYYDDSEVPIDYGVEHKVKKFVDPEISSLELDWEYSDINFYYFLQPQINTARLLIPSNNDVFHLFFGQNESYHLPFLV